MGERNSKNIIKNVFNPFQRFLKIEASGGILLLLATLIALVWANSSFGDAYQHLWKTKLTIGVGNFILSKSFLHWINDGLMAIFFFFVGLEIKRELIAGELSSIKQASLPIAAAFGGMIFPALIFIIVNKNSATEAGWGIPMATDIAFSLGIISLLGKRVPLSLKVFLVAFAIVDDIGAVIVIALFYSGDINWNYLLIGLALFMILVLFNRLDLRYISAYMVVGWVIWFMFLKSGIHPTIAGILIAFSIPMYRKIDMVTFRIRMDDNLKVFHSTDCSNKITLTKKQLVSIDNIEDELKRVQSPVQSLEHTLNQFVTFFVMPLFALTNAGVIIKTTNFTSLFASLSGTIEISLIVGKVMGIFLFTWLSVKLGITELPNGMKWIHILGLGFLGAVGFTMSLFIANLAFADGLFLNPAKIGILTGSVLAGILGYVVIWLTLRKTGT